MFMERGQKELAEQQIRGHPEILAEIEAEEKPKSKKGK